MLNPNAVYKLVNIRHSIEQRDAIALKAQVHDLIMSFGGDPEVLEQGGLSNGVVMLYIMTLILTTP